MNLEDYNIPESHRDMLYKMAEDIHKLFEKHNIKYWCDGGTLLGCLREKGLIKHDDDLDFGMFPKDWRRVKDIYQEIREIGYQIEEHRTVIKIFIPNKWDKVGDRTIGTPTLDLFVYDERKVREGKKIQRYIALLYDEDYNRWPMARHKKADLFPLQLMKFGDIELWCPNNGKPYCDGLYPDWNSKVVIDLRNNNNVFAKSDNVSFNFTV